MQLVQKLSQIRVRCGTARASKQDTGDYLNAEVLKVVVQAILKCN